jgi:hypothetical protein
MNDRRPDFGGTKPPAVAIAFWRIKASATPRLSAKQSHRAARAHQDGQIL